MEYNITHVDGLRFELLSDGGQNNEYDVLFYDYTKAEIVYQTKMKPNSWAKLNKSYLLDIHVIVKHSSKTIKEIRFLDCLKGKKVFINFESKALGDTLAWMPYCDIFRVKYDCEVVVSTFHNYLFEKVYNNLTFVARGVVVNNIIAMFNLGWFYDSNKEPVMPSTIPLQKAATNILNLPYGEVIAKIDFEPSVRPFSGMYVCISTQSTAKLKYWDYWQELIDSLVSMGYKVLEVSKDDVLYKNTTPVLDKSIKNVMNLIHHSDFFIGLSSGLSWLSWALRKRVYMIANFSLEGHEFTKNCIRITNTSVCHGCWNNPLFRFNKGDYLWCPEHEDTPNAFECHKSITAEKVVEIISLHQTLI